MSEKMIFCLGEGRLTSKGEGYQKHLRVFNKDVSEERYQEVQRTLSENEIKIALTHWVDEKDMTKKDKENYSSYKELGGYLKVFRYEEAWATFWSSATQKQKDTILDLPEFDKDIFKEITGIDIKQDSVAQEAIKLLESKGYKIVRN